MTHRLTAPGRAAVVVAAQNANRRWHPLCRGLQMEHRQVCRTIAVAATTHIRLLVWPCCVDWKRDRLPFYKNAAVASVAAFLLALVVLLVAPSPMPRSSAE